MTLIDLKTKNSIYTVEPVGSENPTILGNKIYTNDSENVYCNDVTVSIVWLSLTIFDFCWLDFLTFVDQVWLLLTFFIDWKTQLGGQRWLYQTVYSW